MTPPKSRGKKSIAETGRLDARITRSPSVVAIHADGVWGGLTPKVQIVMGFFTEQWATPERVVYQLPKDVPGKLTEVSRSGGGYFHREIQAQIFMSVDVARTLITWLQEKIETAEAIDRAAAERREIDGSDATGTVLLLPEGDDEE